MKQNMKKTFMVACRVGFVSAALVLTGAQIALAQNYPLELTNIKPLNGGLSNNHRIYRAYPGLEYNIRAAVIGGVYPYTFSLGNAPAGMAINAQTGEISWPNPQANAQPTIVVRDSAGAQVSAAWPITVSITGFVFVDATNGRNAANNGCASSCGTGTSSNPWRTMRDIYQNAPAASIAYFRNGTYGVLDLPRTSAGGAWERVVFSESQNPVIFLAQPGQSPLIDFAYTGGGSVPFIRMAGQSVYVDGFETTRARIMAFQVEHENLRGSTFRRNRMHDLILGGDGTNAAFIMTTTLNGPMAYGMVVQDNSFFNLTTDMVTLKFYGVVKLLVENNVHSNGWTATELKGDVHQFTVRGDIYTGFSHTSIGGNMHGGPTSGEILFNRVINAGQHALDLNQDGLAGRIDVRRNTFLGRVWVRESDAADGPFTFSNNVIINNDSGTPNGSHVYTSASAASRVLLSNNLVGYPSANIVDAQGNLTSAHAQYIGTMGCQTGTASTLPIPSAPTSIRIIR